MSQDLSGGGRRAQRDKEFFPEMSGREVAKAKNPVIGTTISRAATLSASVGSDSKAKKTNESESSLSASLLFSASTAPTVKMASDSDGEGGGSAAAKSGGSAAAKSSDSAVARSFKQALSEPLIRPRPSPAKDVRAGSKANAAAQDNAEPRRLKRRAEAAAKRAKKAAAEEGCPRTAGEVRSKSEGSAEASPSKKQSPGKLKKKADALAVAVAGDAVPSNDVDPDIQFLYVQHQIQTDENYARNLQRLQIINDDADKERSAVADPGTWTEVGRKKSAKAVNGQRKLSNGQEQEQRGKVGNTTEAISKRAREQGVQAAGGNGNSNAKPVKTANERGKPKQSQAATPHRPSVTRDAYALSDDEAEEDKRDVSSHTLVEVSSGSEPSEAEQADVVGHQAAPAMTAGEKVTSKGRAPSSRAPVSSSSSEAEQADVVGHQAVPAASAGEKVTSKGRASSRAPESSSSSEAEQADVVGHQAVPATSAGGRVMSEGELALAFKPKHHYVAKRTVNRKRVVSSDEDEAEGKAERSDSATFSRASNKPSSTKQPPARAISGRRLRK
jgi:hypothetical protein